MQNFLDVFEGLNGNEGSDTGFSAGEAVFLSDGLKYQGVVGYGFAGRPGGSSSAFKVCFPCNRFVLLGLRERSKNGRISRR